MKVYTINGCEGNCSRTIKDDYFKMGVANFLWHTNDGYAATAVMIQYEAERTTP